MLNEERLQQNIIDIKNLLSKEKEISAETIMNVATILASIKEFCRMQGIVCNNCPFYVNDKVGCCFISKCVRDGTPEGWTFK